MQASVHEALARGERLVITRQCGPAAELVPARNFGIRMGSLEGRLKPPPEACSPLLSSEDLHDWGAE